MYLQQYILLQHIKKSSLQEEILPFIVYICLL